MGNGRKKANERSRRDWIDLSVRPPPPLLSVHSVPNDTPWNSAKSDRERERESRRVGAEILNEPF